MTQKIAIWAPSHNFVGLYLRKESMYRQSETISPPHVPMHNMVNFGPLAAEIVSGVWGTPATFNGFRVLAAFYCTTCSSGRQPYFAALNTGRHICSAGRPSRWALAHILVFLYFYGRCM